MFRKNLIIIITVIFNGEYLVEGRLTNIVETDKGPVQGEIVKTVQDSSIEYSAFRGIPYAKPPIGELRFQPPVESDAWSETLLTTSEAPSCPQLDNTGSFHGDENCLYLNVYSPKTTFNKCEDDDDDDDDELLAVMVWIFGGEFVSGEIDSSVFGPDFLIAGRDVVIIDMNYRLGALGFLSLDIEEATGNMGLKDQVLALKWVQKNIEKFGGDPEKVTIFGQSAGSVGVLLHQMSPASQGLFRGAIAMSGSPLNPWGFNTLSSAISQAFDVGKALGIRRTSKKLLYKLLLNATAEQLVFATNNKTGADMGRPTFKPTYENPKIAKDIFLSQCPIKHYETGNYSKIPIILGFTNAEILLFTIKINNFIHAIKSGKIHLESLDLKNHPSVLLNETVEQQFNFSTDDNNTHVSSKLSKKNRAILYAVINETTDFFFVTGIDSTQKYLTQDSSPPVYYYRNSFDYEESLHRLAGLNLNGTGHSDDLPHIFYYANRSQSLNPNSRIGVHRTKMVRMWTNFAKYLNPTPEGKDDSLLNVNWCPSGHEGAHLEIGNDGTLQMGTRPTDNFVKILQKLSNIAKHATCPRR